MVVELPGSNIPWAEPRDVTLDELVAAIREMDRSGKGTVHPRESFFTYSGGGINVALADGSVRYLANTVPEETLRAMATIAGQDKIPEPTQYRAGTTHIKWGRVISLTIFVLLALAPVVRRRK